MTIDVVSGKNFACSKRSVRFFDIGGEKLDNGRWLITTTGDSEPVESNPTSILDQVISLIVEAEANQEGQLASRLQLSHRKAIVFFLEGSLSCDDLKRATEGEGSVLIPKVNIKGRTLDVHVLDFTPMEVILADAEGHLL